MPVLKDVVLRSMCAVGVYPHIFFSRSPLKAYEYYELTRGVEFSEHDRVLDIGCYRGLQAALLAKKCGEVIGIDISEPDLERARRVARAAGRRLRCDFRCVRLEHAGFEDNSFDKIYSFSVLEHIPNYEKVLKEAYRILKPDGRLQLSVDALESIDDEYVRAVHRSRFYVEQYFTRSQLRSLLDGIGFRNITIYPIFRSAYAKKLFLRNVLTPFSSSYVRPVMQYFRLRTAEARANGADKGIFLIITATK